MARMEGTDRSKGRIRELQNDLKVCEGKAAGRSETTQGGT